MRESESIVGVNLAATVSCDKARAVGEGDLPQSHAFAVASAASDRRYKVVAYDCGVKDSILHNLVRCGCDVTAVPWDTPADDVLAMGPDGVFLSQRSRATPKRSRAPTARWRSCSARCRCSVSAWGTR